MEIIIDDAKKLEEIQSQFSKQYPGLKLEFFAKPHSDEEASPRSEKLDKNLTVGQARKIHTTGMVTIHANQKVSELEKDFQETFGLPVQVFRKAGESWIETIDTDNWTIREQNKYAKEIDESSMEPESKYPAEPNEPEQF